MSLMRVATSALNVKVMAISNKRGLTVVVARTLSR